MGSAPSLRISLRTPAVKYIQIHPLRSNVINLTKRTLVMRSVPLFSGQTALRFEQAESLS